MPTIINPPELETALKSLPDWQVVENKLHAKFVFTDFIQAFAWMKLVAAQAEVLNHHPSWSNTYNTVEVTLATHDSGDTITDLDVALAKFMSNAARSISN